MCGAPSIQDMIAMENSPSAVPGRAEISEDVKELRCGHWERLFLDEPIEAE